jgi:hypothetical protein
MAWERDTKDERWRAYRLEKLACNNNNNNNNNNNEEEEEDVIGLVVQTIFC